MTVSLQFHRGEPLELRPHLSLYSDALIVTGSEVFSISVEPIGHTLYLGKLLSAQPLSITVLSELCLHLASVRTLHKDHVLLLTVVKKNLSRGLALCDEGVRTYLEFAELLRSGLSP